MGYELCLGDRAYSSWSLRGWLLFEKFGIEAKLHYARMYEDTFLETLADFRPDGYVAPLKTVPAWKIDNKIMLSDSIAITEELHARHPDAGLLPTDPQMRAIARNLIAEMHSGFVALRAHCPMNLRLSYSDCAASEAVLSDLNRLEILWAEARKLSGSQTPWLLGDYCAADAFFAPVAARVAGYGLPLNENAMTYVTAHLSDPSFRRYRAMGCVDGPDQPFYDREYPRRDWPLAPEWDAEISNGEASENALCPYSQKPVTDFLRLKGREFGFCNPFCRDKTMMDPTAWPAFMDLYHS